MVTSFEIQKKEKFFHQQEMFMGHSMVDVHLNDFVALKTAIDIRNLKNQGTIIENCLEADIDRQMKFRKDGVIRDLRIVNNDFTFNNEIERCFTARDSMIQKLLLTTIMEINTPEYQMLMMQILGKILLEEDVNPNLVYILDFFKRPDGISAKKQFCNFEIFMFDRRLPMKSI